MEVIYKEQKEACDASSCRNRWTVVHCFAYLFDEKSKLGLEGKRKHSSVHVCVLLIKGKFLRVETRGRQTVSKEKGG